MEGRSLLLLLLLRLILTFTLLLVSITCSSNAENLILDPSDYQALLTIQRSLGLVNQTQTTSPHPCASDSVFCHSRRITRLRFLAMGLHGFLSPAVGKLTELKELSVPDNYLVDLIPQEIVRCRKLEILNLRNNLFNGSVPPQLSLLTNLAVVDLSSNMLSGNLSFLNQLTNLKHLSLSDNRLSGTVPVSVWSFPKLDSFDVSGNPLISGPIPDPGYIYARRRSMLTLAKGPITSSEDGTEETTSAPAPSPVLTPDAADGPSPYAHGDSNDNPTNNNNNNKKKKHNKLGMVLGFFAGLVAGGICGLLLSLLIKTILTLVMGKKKTGPTIFSPNVIKKRQDLAFLDQEDGLAALQIIGRGGCGEVYKAELPDGSGINLAIKKIIQPPLDADELTEEDTKMLGKKMRQIRSEIITVGKIRHRNLLPLLAHIPRPDCHYLVYEYMKNGSLQDMLEDVKQGRKELHWLARFRIAIGVAHGLEYLHFGQSPMIIHRDMKPANILLDDHMEAKIGDFGLAKTMPDANTHVSSSNVAGTRGYIAPEYYRTLKFTDKCDIYSFGVVLGVLVMGKFPSDDFFQNTEEMSLVGWMRNVMTSDNPIQAIDPNLLENGFEEDMLLVLKIACFCTLEDPKQRPDSKNVRLMLAQIIKN